MQQVKRILDEMDAAGLGLRTDGSPTWPDCPFLPGWDKPEGATAEDPDGRQSTRVRRKAAFLDRLYGPMPAQVRR